MYSELAETASEIYAIFLIKNWKWKVKDEIKQPSMKMIYDNIVSKIESMKLSKEMTSETSGRIIVTKFCDDSCGDGLYTDYHIGIDFNSFNDDELELNDVVKI